MGTVTMKFSVEVETNSSLYPAPGHDNQNLSALNWDIIVEVEQVEQLPQQEQQQLIKEVKQVEQQQQQEQQIEQEIRETEGVSSVSKKTRKISTSGGSIQINGGPKKVETSTSSAIAEERKLSQLMNPRGRKVTRMGDYLVFTERNGILTSQNGVQQVKEERVKINAEDLARLVEMGF